MDVSNPKSEPLESVDLGRKGRSYLQDYLLNCGKHLGRILHETVTETPGTVFVAIPSSSVELVQNRELEEFRFGGVGSSDDSRKDFAIRVQKFLDRYPEGQIVFAHLAASKGDPFLRTGISRGANVLFCEQDVYFVPCERSTAAVIDTINAADTATGTMGCVLCPFDDDFFILAHSDAEAAKQLSQRAILVAASIFDGESFIYWVRKPD